MRTFLLLTFFASTAFASERRIAVLVGANGAVDGRQALRFAESDAQQMAQVLEQVGHFAKEDVLVAQNPTPTQLWSLLDVAADKMRGVSDGLIFFYFSGHADDKSIYMHGEAADIETLRHKLEASGAQIRIGFLDACFGGAWTRSKGLSVKAPFVVQTPIDTGSAGSVLISSSTGDESAHESDALLGSFFTHHFIAGLRGAADTSGDGEITLAEAFDYAKTLTIRDTSEQAPSPQHPSFDINLRGRRDIVIAQLASGPTTLQVSEVRGPLQLIHLQSGLVVLEIEPGRRHVTLAVPAGRYLLRRTADNGNYAREITLVAGQTLTIDEADLRLVSTDTLAMKRVDSQPLYTNSTLPKGEWEIDPSITVGPNLGTAGVSLSSFSVAVSDGPTLTVAAPTFWGITDRLQYKVGTGEFAYRFGNRGGIELIPHGGLSDWGLIYNAKVAFTLDAGLDARFWIGPRDSFILGARGSSSGYIGPKGMPSEFSAEQTLSLGLSYSLTLGGFFTINFGVAAIGHSAPGSEGATDVEFGGVKSIGGRPLPMLQISLNRFFAIDLNPVLVLHPTSGQTPSWQLQAGGTFTF